MKCPYCKHTESKVIYTIYVSTKKDTVRRRNCLGCNTRFTTIEVLRNTDKKKDAQKQLS